jgi:heterodisulfide reductase subunit A-like polyferredoxin
VFVCDCGQNIAGAIDVDKVAAYAASARGNHFQERRAWLQPGRTGHYKNGHRQEKN